LTLDREGRRLYVAEDNADRIAEIDTVHARLLAEWPLRLAGVLPGIPGRGITADGLALSRDERSLYVAAAGINAVGIVDLPRGRLRGWIPTGWYPTDVSESADGRRLYLLNAKSHEGPNRGNCVQLQSPPAAAAGCPADRPASAANDYVLQHSKAALATLPLPDAATLARLTLKVQENNEARMRLSPAAESMVAALRARIRHVIYIVKENRTYDQILGDLPVGNGDPAITQFPAGVTPNQHRLASRFVDLDAFYDSGEVSGTGWPWSVAARTADVTEKTIPEHYASRGFSYDSEGTNRDVNVGYATVAKRAAANPMSGRDPDLLAGATDVAAPDGPADDEREQGYLWDAALRSHLSVRNYGFFTDLSRYSAKIPAPFRIPLERDPAARHTVVAFGTNPHLASLTDPYFRGFDNQFPDFYRYREWQREFDAYERSDSLPALELVRFMHDHLGNFGTAIDGVNTPERQVADNDYAVGLLVERIAHSRYAADTLILVVEDDAQDGPDHVDAHRSIALIAGPFVKQEAVISTRYTTVNLLRTIEVLLGLDPLNIHDALAGPMLDVFDLARSAWSYEALVPASLRATSLPLPPATAAAVPDPCRYPERAAAYWAKQSEGLDFDVEDRVDAAKFNRIVWAGQRPDAYPAVRSGADLRAGREALLAERAMRCRAAAAR
jgi:DNA-binding beta-propeller fold protein YncE